MLVLTILFLLAFAVVLALADMVVYGIKYVGIHCFGCTGCGPITNEEVISLTTSAKVLVLSVLVYFASIGLRVVLGMPIEELF